MQNADVINIHKFLDDIPQTLFNELSLPINFVDRECKVVVMNNAFLNFLGLELDNVVGMHLTDIDASTRFPIVLETGIPEIGQPHRFISGKTAQVDRIPLFDGDRIIGAAGIIVKPDITPNSIDYQIRQSIINRIRPSLPQNTGSLPKSLQAKYTFDSIISKSPIMKHFKSRARSFAATDLPVLITGESGVGKELFAHAIHNESKRKDKPFVSINCAAIPDNLIESELFGYEAGSFTGANKTGKKGKFELADKGTVFLDEIGDLPPMMQSKLLRFLQENQIEKIGSAQPIEVDVRIIAATNVDLLSKISSKEFRSDLYYRINVLNLNIPSLFDRKEDIQLLIEHFRSLFYIENGIYKTFSEDVLHILTDYHWPGNIRELKNIVYRLVVLANEEMITRDLLPDTIIKTHYQNLSTPYNPSSYLEKGSLAAIMKEIEVQIIEDTLNFCDQNKSKAADLLGIKRMTLYRKLKKD